MADTGLRVAQVGYSADNCADYQLLFSSAWPSLAVAFETTLSVPLGDPASTITVPHNLGFYPYVNSFIIKDGVYIGSGNGGYGVGILFDKQNIYVTGDDVSSYTVNLKCYNIDVSKPVSYANLLSSAVKLPYNSDYGIKVAKAGADINSTDLRNFILHSRAQSPTLLSIVTETSLVPSPLGAPYSQISYTPAAGYLPWVFGFIKTDTSLSDGAPVEVYSPVAFSTQTAFGLTFSGSTSILTYNATTPTTGLAASIVVLRDPLVAPNNVDTTYNG